MNNQELTLNDKITRIVATQKQTCAPKSYLIEAEIEPTMIQHTTEPLAFKKDGLPLITQTAWSLKEKPVVRYRIEGEKAKIVIRKTVDGERSFVENASDQVVGTAYEASLSFSIEEGEAIYGLGQQERGIYNYRNIKEYLYQNNMMIPMPVFLSSKGYALFFDASCLMTYEESNNTITLVFDAVEQIDYYIITGPNFDELIKGIRTLTGKATLLPKWAFGYIQSKERYRTQEELLLTAEKFEEQNIPLSCLVLDWHSWEEGKWGNKILDKSRFPSLKEAVSKLHEKQIAFMISIWPNMNQGCENNIEFLEAGKLLSNLSTYDAFDQEARELYWKQCERELFATGLDAWWCDSTEPFTPDWGGTEEKTPKERYELAKSELARQLDARDANAFALMHAKGIYENQRKAYKDKRVVNLTRSGSPSIQKYGVILWSGDIKADWEVLRSQVTEALSISLSGIPFWTLDIGAFFAGNTKAWRKWSNSTEGEAPWFWKGKFEDGVDDLGFREIYTRWLQLGTFLPIMRSHGTDTPREPWNFGGPGTKYYDTILKYIKLRYHLLPYIYSIAGKVYRDDYTMMRSLIFDFPRDPNVKEISDSYLFGPSFLVCPVTEAMEYGPESTKLSLPMVREVYLPAGCGWFDYETNVYYEGGQTISADAPIEKMPLFVKAGSIIPLYDHTEENGTNAWKIGTPNRIDLYEGDDAFFELYLDNGKDYQYEIGNYCLLPLKWNNTEKVLYVGKIEGDYPYPGVLRVMLHTKDGSTKESIFSINQGSLSFFQDI